MCLLLFTNKNGFFLHTYGINGSYEVCNQKIENIFKIPSFCQTKSGCP